MGTALVTLPDGRKAQVTFDSQEQLDATVADLSKDHAAAPAAKTDVKPPGAAQPAPSPPMLGTPALGAGEAALKVGSGLVGSAVGGVAGLARGAGAGIASLAQGESLGQAGQAFSNEATDTIQGVSGAMTYQPRTQAGRGIAAGVELPFKLLAAGADVAGRKSAEFTGSPAVGAAVNTAIQAAPALVGAKVGRMVAGEDAAAAAGSGPRGTTGTGGRPGIASTAEGRAQAYARDHGLDWAGLADATKTTLTRIASDAKSLEKLGPQAVEREAFLQQQRIPINTTRGKLTRDAADLRREAVASKTDAGQPIRDIDSRANRDIQANLEVLRGRKAGLRGGLHDPAEEGAPSGPSVRAPTKPTEDVGSSVQGSVRAKAAKSKRNYDALYKKARETEPNAAVAADPLYQHLEENPEVQHTTWLQGWLKRAKIEKTTSADGIETVERRPITLNELHDLREKAGGIARAGGTEGHYAAQVVKSIDRAMEEVPEGAKAWKEANDAFRKHQREFKDQAIVKKLVTNKGGDRALALEKTARTIAQGSLEQIRQVKKTLLTQEGPKSGRFEGRQAWRDLQGETVNRILEEARNVVATDEAERQVLTAAALRKGINSVGRDRLTEILGKRSTDELYGYLRAAKITRTEPAGRVTESGTVPNALVLAEKGLAHFIPGGKYIRGAKEAVKSLGERGKAAREADKAIQSPLQQAAAESERRAASRNAAKRRTLTTLRAARGLSPGAGDINQDRQ